MADQPGVWGIDVGQCALKAIRLIDNDGQVTATAFDYVEHPKILSQPDADPDQLTREALEKFLSRNSLRGDLVAISVPGQSGLARFVKLPPVEEKKITDIVRFEAKQQIPFPLEEVVWDYQKIGAGTVTEGFAMETEIGLFAMKRDMINRSMQHFADVDVEVHIVQMSPLALCNFVSYDLLGKGTPAETGAEGKPPEGGADQKEAIQAKRDFLKPKVEEGDRGGKKRCVVALDIGADNSNLVITDGERIIWQRPIPVGGNHFTRALTKEMKLTFAKAEHLKRNATKSPDLKKILSSLRPVLNEFVSEVQRSLGYFTNTHRDAHIDAIIGLGSAFRLPGLQKFLSEKLQLEVHKLEKLERLAGDSVITAPAFTQNVLSFGVAYGLALQGLKKTRIQTNLLPQEIRFERMIRAKKPWAVAAAAALLIAVVGTTIGYTWQNNAVASRPVLDAMDKGRGVVKEFNDWNSKFSSKMTNEEKEENDVRQIIFGQEERVDLLMLHQFVDECMPVPALRLDGKFERATSDGFVVLDPDGKEKSFKGETASLVAGNKLAQPGDVKKGAPVAVIYQEDPGALVYWKDPQTREAYLKYWERQGAGKGGPTKAEDDKLDHLIQLNLESIYALYSPEVKGVYAGLSVKDDPLLGMDEKEKKDLKDGKGPEGKGWVVELRGYTYFYDSPDFIIKTLVHQLNARGKTPEQAAEGAAPAPESQPKPQDTPNKPGEPASPKPAEQTTKPAEGTKKSVEAPAPAPDADQAKDEKAAKVVDPVKEKEEIWSKVIRGKVSGAFVFDYKPVPNPEPGHYEIIGGSVLGNIVGSGAAAAAATPAAEGAEGTRKGASSSAGTGSWSPLFSIGSGSSGSLGAGPAMPGPGGGGPGGFNMMDRMNRMKSMFQGGGPPGMSGGAAVPGVTGTKPDPKAQKKTPMRFEFFIIFVWKEPTPSDDRMEGEKPVDASAGK
jgi:type IV pilus assembly protein PilM